ncbi:unnamed protein product, partial [Porites evermanni]
AWATCADSDYHNSSEVLGTSQPNNFIMADVEESLGIGESLSVNNDQINDIIASLPEEERVSKKDDLKEEKKILTEEDPEDQISSPPESLRVSDVRMASKQTGELATTNGIKLNGDATEEKLPREENVLVSEKDDDMFSKKLEQESNLELPDTKSESNNTSSAVSFESSHADGGSHRSPDRKSKAEYRKIKSEVTGEGETSESEDDDETTEKNASAHAMDQEADTWMDLLGNGLLKKRILKEGKGRDTRPDKGQVVTLQVAGHTEDGKAVDWNRSLEFILGEGEVIQAFDLAVALMELEEVCELVTDSRYAYGKAGKPEANPPIPADAKLTYELHLLAVRDGPNITNMTDEERITIGEKKREIGNNLYTGGDYAGAINSYQRAIKYLSTSTAEQVQILRVKCWNNMAAAQLKIKAYSAAEKSCSQVLQIDPDNVKALFRKGKVLAGNGETEQALVYIKKADQLDPNNKTIRGELNRLKQLLASEKRSERTMYQRMLADMTGAQGNKKNKRTVSAALILLLAKAL